MPKSKDLHSLLTATERERLVNRTVDPNRSDEEKEKHQNSIYHNDMVVRTKIKSWLIKAEDILFALESLPKRTFKKELDDDDVYGLFWVGIELLRILDFAPIENLSGIPVVSKSVLATDNGQKDAWTRHATEKDFERNYSLYLIKNKLEEMVSTADIFKQYRFEKMGNAFFDSYDQKKRHFEEMISKSNKKIAEDPSNAEAWYEKGVALNALERWEEALECLDKATHLPSTYWTFSRAINAKKNMLYFSGRRAEAEAEEFMELFALVESDPSNAYDRALLGELLCEKRRYGEAIEWHNEAIKLDPSNAGFWTGKGKTLYKMGKFKKAIQCFDKAIELGPSFPQPYENRGKVLKALGRNDEAEICFSKAKELEGKLNEAMEAKKSTQPPKNE